MLFLLSHDLNAQWKRIDSLKLALGKTSNDTLRLQLAGELADAFTEIRPDSAEFYAGLELDLARKLGYRLNECYALQQAGYALTNMGNYPKSLRMLLSAITIAEDPESEQRILPDHYVYGEDVFAHAATPYLKRLDKLARMHQYVGILYGNAGNNEKERSHYLLARNLAEETGNILLQSYCNGTLGRAYLLLKKPDSALLTIQKAYDQSTQVGYRKYQGSILLNFARIHAAMNRPDLAMEYFRKALAVSRENFYLRGVVAANLALAEIYQQKETRDSALFCVQQALDVARQLNAPPLLLRSYAVLAEYYRSAHRSDSLVKYQDLIIRTNEGLFNAKQAQLFQSIDFDEQQRQQQKEAADRAYRNRIKMYSLLAGLAVFLVLAIILVRINYHKQKAYALLKAQKLETDAQREKAEQTLTELRATQAQLIQSEKMASLGELTAGIAHEIENPLNFVNNFSEINAELCEEMEGEMNAGNWDAVRSLAGDILENNKKIASHGQRADSIVRGMLQHSRVSTGQKEPVDLNALADEYLRLSYHGLRAKQKDFHADISTSFDEAVGRLNIVRQDIGRVLLNLYNNAFYAVAEKQKLALPGYEPKVSVTTRRISGKVEISVKDNGNGISQKIRDKIFQPFFTTKPSGQGTGLGLSISYDIVRAHQGEIEVVSREGGGAEFLVRLPC